jgi:hypothetical protein
MRYFLIGQTDAGERFIVAELVDETPCCEHSDLRAALVDGSRALIMLSLDVEEAATEADLMATAEGAHLLMRWRSGDDRAAESVLAGEARSFRDALHDDVRMLAEQDWRARALLAAGIPHKAAHAYLVEEGGERDGRHGLHLLN